MALRDTGAAEVERVQEGAAVPAVPRHFEIGPRGQSRNAQFQRFTTRTQRPVVRFDLCTKCTLCWFECPDECFDPTNDGLLRHELRVLRWLRQMRRDLSG